jgi:flavin-dependent dehydrogenase
MAAQVAGRKRDFVLETLETQFPDVAERLSGVECEPAIRTIGCFGHICRPPVADGALLVGDAATFIDPFTGEGIYFSLRGAQLAAEVAASALRADDLSQTRLMTYARARRELNQRYLLCDVVQAVVRRPALLSRVVRRLNTVPGLADRLLSILGDLRPPTDALHPAFLWRLLAPGM